VRELLARPRAEHDVERLLEDRARLVDRHPEDAVLRELVAAPDADVDPPAGHVVEERDALGEAQRVREGQVDDRGADPDAGSTCGDVTGEEERVSREAVRREVLLGDPHVVEADRLGELRARELLGDDAPGVSTRRTLEHVVRAEAHGSLSSAGALR
jgi:hypothetical protein